MTTVRQSTFSEEAQAKRAAWFAEYRSGEGVQANRAAASTEGERPAAVQATGPNAWSQHPLWSAWLALHPAVREAFEQSFPNYLDMRRMGKLDQFIEFVNESLAHTIAAAEQDLERRARASANSLQTTHVGYRSPSRDRQSQFAREIAEAKDNLHRTMAVR